MNSSGSMAFVMSVMVIDASMKWPRILPTLCAVRRNDALRREPTACGNDWLIAASSWGPGSRWKA